MQQHRELTIIKLPEFPNICIIKTHEILEDFTFDNGKVIMFQQECHKEGPSSLYIETTILHRDSLEHFSTVVEDELLYSIPNIITLVEVDMRTHTARICYRGGLIAQFVDGNIWKKTLALTLEQWRDVVHTGGKVRVT